MKKLVVFRRHKYEVHRIKWKIMITTLFYFITTGGIKWVLYQSFSCGSLKFEPLSYFIPILNQIARVLPIRPDRINIFNDFSKEWVAHASHKVILISIYIFNFVILFYHFTNIVSTKCRNNTAEDQLTHLKMK